MNKLISLLLCALLALSLLTACGPTEVESNENGPAPAENTESGKKPNVNYLADKKFDTDEYLEGYDSGLLCYSSS